MAASISKTVKVGDDTFTVSADDIKDILMVAQKLEEIHDKDCQMLMCMGAKTMRLSIRTVTSKDGVTRDYVSIVTDNGLNVSLGQYDGGERAKVFPYFPGGLRKLRTNRDHIDTRETGKHRAAIRDIANRIFKTDSWYDVTDFIHTQVYPICYEWPRADRIDLADKIEEALKLRKERLKDGR